jgi:2,3-diketo-5-methylthio-1-phosphopentane phosphatase
MVIRNSDFVYPQLAYPSYTDPSDTDPSENSMDTKLSEFGEMLKKQSVDLRVFVDFDGTISMDDIGDRLFEEFGHIQPFNTEFKNGEMSIFEYWKKVTATLPPDLTAEHISDYSQDIQIDAYFIRFLDFCKGLGIMPTIVSDGFIDYIRPVLDKEKIAGIDIFSNKLSYGPDGTKPVFPYSKDGCECKSAVCKRSLVSLRSKPESIIVYIGDGYSDFCPAEASDIVFAKKNLAKWCNNNSVPHHPYRSFYNVVKILSNKIQKRTLKQRNRAKIIRSKMFIYE